MKTRRTFTEKFKTLGERSAGYVASKSDIIRVHLLPFFGKTALADITAGKVQECRAHRQTSRLDPKTGKPKKPASGTLHHEIVTLRQVLKTANCQLQGLDRGNPRYVSALQDFRQAGASRLVFARGI